jgi:hypothetical protein
LRTLALIVLLALVSSLSGCGKRPYTTRADALKSQIAKIRSAAAKASAMTPPLPANERKSIAEIGSLGTADRIPPVTLDPPLAVGGSFFITARDSKAPLANALVMTADDLAALADNDHRGDVWFDGQEEGASCLREATLVMEKGECLPKGCDSDSSARCTQYLLGLRYVLVITKDVDTDDTKNYVAHRTEVFAGRAVLVALDSQQTWPAVRFVGSHSYSTSNSTLSPNEVKSPMRDAVKALAAELGKRFPGTKTPKEWTEENR